MERIPKGLYTPEFRVEAAAKRLSVPKSSLGNRVRASRKGKLATVGQGQRVPTEAEMELARLGYLSPAAFIQQYYAKQMAA